MSSLPPQWSCKRCTFLNYHDAITCSICGDGTLPEKITDSVSSQVVDLTGGSDDDESKGPIKKMGKKRAPFPMTKVSLIESEESAPRCKYQTFAIIDLTEDGGSHQNRLTAHKVAATLGSGTGLWVRKSLRKIRKQHREDLKMAQQLQAQEEQVQRKKRARIHHNCLSDEAFARALQEAEDEERREPEDSFDVLADHRGRIHEMLQKHSSGLRIKAVEENVHAKVGTKLYNRFVEAWQRVEDQTVILAFHGTAEANIESIRKYGLDPKCRSGQSMGAGEYFGKEANVSLPYCRGGKRLHVVALPTDKSAPTAEDNLVIVINKPDHQLPLFVVRLE